MDERWVQRGIRIEIPTFGFGKYHYTTLDFVGPDCSMYNLTTQLSQTVWREPPAGWEIAPDQKEIRDTVIAMNEWSCDALVLASGNAYYTRKGSKPGEQVSNLGTPYNGCLERRETAGNDPSAKNGGAAYRVGSIRLKSRILIRVPWARSGYTPRESCEQLWKKRRFTDFAIVCQGQEFPCHRAVLVEASSELDAIVSTNMREGLEQRLEINDFEPQVVEDFVAHMYTGWMSTPPGDATHPASLLLLADRYGLKKLFDLASQVVIWHLSPANVAEVWQKLKPFKDVPSLQPVWVKLRAIIKSDDKLFDAAMP